MRYRFLPVCALLVSLLLGTTRLCAEEQSAPAIAEKSEKAAKRSVTVFPIRIRPGKKVTIDIGKRLGEIVAMMLERAGIEDIDVAEAGFTAPETSDVSQIAASFGKFVAGRSIGSDYAIYAEFVGTPKTGVKEIRTMVVDKSGKVVLADRDDPKTFSQTSSTKPTCPMTCSEFVVKKIQKLWGLGDPLRPARPSDKMYQRWLAKYGLPSQSELAAVKKRYETLKKKAKTSSLTIYPIRVGKAADKQCAAGLAEMFRKQKIDKIIVSNVVPKFQIQPDPNEQKVLWDTAKAFRRFLQKNPPATDYALFVDYGIWGHSPEKTKVGYVHAVLCDRQGDWVIVDYQNSHHADFKEIQPKSPHDCNRLLVRRLERFLCE